MNWLENFQVLGLKDFTTVSITSCDSDMMPDPKMSCQQGGKSNILPKSKIDIINP